MKTSEFRRATFRTASQWKSGLAVGLRILKEGGIELPPRPRLAKTALRTERLADAHDVAIGECGRIFWSRKQEADQPSRCEALIKEDDPPSTCELFLFSPGDKEERVVARFTGPELRLDLVGDLLAVLELSTGTAFVLRTTSRQILAEARVPGAVDVALDAAGRLYVMDRSGVHLFGLDGTRQRTVFEEIHEPLALAVVRDGSKIYLSDQKRDGLVWVETEGGRWGCVGNFDSDVALDYRPDFLCVSPAGTLFALQRGEGAVTSFWSDGTFLGRVGPEERKARAVSVSENGDLWIVVRSRVLHFEPEGGASTSSGTYYTRTLDNGPTPGELWHRLDLLAKLPVRSQIKISYACLGADQSDQRFAIDAIFDAAGSPFAKRRRIELALKDRWSDATTVLGSERKGEHNHGILLRGAPGDVDTPTATISNFPRYLLVKLELETFDTLDVPRVNGMDAVRPRLTYHRYLPAVYQRDAQSRVLLERFLAASEAVFETVEHRIDGLAELFHPESSTADFLGWLAGWMNLVLEAGWPEETKRQLLLRAGDLFRRKGTPSGAAEFLSLVLSGIGQGEAHAFVEEHARRLQPIVLGRTSRLGADAMVAQAPRLSALRLRTSRLGSVPLRAQPSTLQQADVFRQLAHRVTVNLEIEADRFERLRPAFERVLREVLPAHVTYELRKPGCGLGRGMRMVQIEQASQGRVYGSQPRLSSAPRAQLGTIALVGRSAIGRGARVQARLGEGVRLMQSRTELS